MILNFDKQRIETIQKDRLCKVRFAVLCGLYKATGICDWEIKVNLSTKNKLNSSFYTIKAYVTRASVLNLMSNKREYQTFELEIKGFDLRLDDIFKETFGKVRKWQM